MRSNFIDEHAKNPAVSLLVESNAHSSNAHSEALPVFRSPPFLNITERLWLQNEQAWSLFKHKKLFFGTGKQTKLSRPHRWWSIKTYVHHGMKAQPEHCLNWGLRKADFHSSLCENCSISNKNSKAASKQVKASIYLLEACKASPGDFYFVALRFNGKFSERRLKLNISSFGG